MQNKLFDLNGYTDLPSGKVATIVTYLEMRARPLLAAAERPDLSLERVTQADLSDYRRLFREIGEDWLWFGRLVLDDEELSRLLAEPTRELYLPRKNGKAVGMLELDFQDPRNVELAYFGLVPDAIGGGAGRWLMARALELVWSRPATERFWVHTCTADSPQALGFYRSVGFAPYKRAIEIADDPREAGLMPESAAPHLPFIPTGERPDEPEAHS
ncbi:GNAT family N-acetyltransferase [Stappia sp. F7233]|uniref:GNAT family N-acetyltransferase n=1 Tax=Stappia albiluteola TaxID=2758565 RepID=A0A839A926_9HYPH|nr:GNAT family N-acetyltransferase [Stappia albiluteola]MBA5775716.1 GNAT family N-acetyltransferase [Stappia albiluteola]